MGEKAGQDKRGCAKTINQFGKIGSWNLGLLASGEATSFPLSINPWCFPGCQGVRQSPLSQTHLVIQENPQDGCHHAQDVGAGDRVPQHDQGHRDDHDSLGGVGDRVAQRTDEVEDAEGNDVLGKVTEATDSQKQERPGPLGHIGLQTGARQHHGHMPALAEVGRAAQSGLLGSAGADQDG